MTNPTPWRTVYTGDGVQTDFQAPTNYIRRSHVEATVDGVLTPFTFITDSLIRFETAPANGLEVVITRTPPVDQAIHTFESSTVITKDALNDNQRQALQITERALYSNESDLAQSALQADNADTASEAIQLTPGARINGVLFDGTEDINIFADGENATFADEATVANRLKFNRTINGVVFNGTGNITITAAPTPYKEHKTVYVSSTGVNNWANRGYARAPLATIEYALEQIAAQPDPYGWTVMLLGDIETDGEIEVPDFTTIQGQNFQRRTVIRPTAGNEVSNVFLCGNGCHLVNLKFTGWQIDDLENPTKGFAMAFRPGAVILPGGVPYGQNCVVTAALTEVPTPLPGDPENQNEPAQVPGGGCVLADASMLSGYTVYPNIMTWGFTPASKNGIGYVARNRAHINCVNAIGVGQHIHFMALDGGNVVLSACSSQFGDYSLWSQGSVMRTEPLKVNPSLIVAEPGAQAALEAIKADAVSATSAFTATLQAWTPEQVALYETDMGLIVDALGVCLEFGTEEPMLNIADGLFGFDGVAFVPYADLWAWKTSWLFLWNYILSNTAFSGGADFFLDALRQRLFDTFDNYFYETGEGPAPNVIEPVRVRMRSLVTAISHQWTAPLAGTQFFRVPPSSVSRAIERSIVQRDGGKVRYSGQDDRGNAVFVGGLKIDARSGELGGPPFEQAIKARVTRNVIARTY